VLLGQRRKGDRTRYKWEFPGGKVEHGESPRQALVRELREELQIEAKIGVELARYEHDYPSGSRVHLLFFVVKEYRPTRTARLRTDFLGDLATLPGSISWKAISISSSVSHAAISANPRNRCY
jgi:mutator protein MutT